ncbi:histidine kinase dimerization/phosphoacceptor domain -containing protein [Ekhidna sp.]
MRIREWLIPPKSLDEIAKKEIASLLKQVLVVVPVVSIIVSLTFLINDQVAVGRLILLIPIISIICQRMLALGHIHFAMITTLLTLTSITTSVAIQTQGLHSTAIVVFPVIVLFSSLIMNLKGVVVITTSIIVCLGIITLTSPPIISINDKSTFQHIRDYVIVASILLTNVFVTISFTSLTKRSLRRATEELGNQEKIKKNIQESLMIKKKLLREVHHRVKNSLAMVNSLIELEAMIIQGGKNEFQALKDMVQTIGRAHDPLYQDQEYGKVPIKSYVEKISSNFSQTNNLEEIEMDIEDGPLSHENALSLGIILQGVFSLLKALEIKKATIKIELDNSKSEMILAAKLTTPKELITEQFLETALIHMLVSEQNGHIRYINKNINISLPLSQREAQ